MDSREDRIRTELIDKEGSLSNSHFPKWKDVVTEIRTCQEDLTEINKKSSITRDPVRTDGRSVRPVPRTSNGFYGWLATRPEFKLEKYGPDLPYSNLPILDVHRLIKFNNFPKNTNTRHHKKK